MKMFDSSAWQWMCDAVPDTITVEEWVPYYCSMHSFTNEIVKNEFSVPPVGLQLFNHAMDLVFCEKRPEGFFGRSENIRSADSFTVRVLNNNI